jgi:hypothetical protein
MTTTYAKNKKHMVKWLSVPENRDKYNASSNAYYHSHPEQNKKNLRTYYLKQEMKGQLKMLTAMYE